jgi:D-amino peptidase
LKIFISSDIEGTAGIADWGQVLTSGEYEMGRRLLLNEVNAAIDGAIAGGARSVVVNDSHWTMQNLYPAELHGRASYISGKHKPLYMMEVLSHTYNPFAFHDVKLNGRVVGESALNALVALHHKVPVALITGDDVTIAEAEPFMPGIEGVVVKRSITRFAAESVHPEQSCRLIQAGAQAAVERAAGLSPPAIDLPATIELTFLTSDMADMATWIRGVERAGVRSVTITDDEPLRLFRCFVTVVALTRSIVEGP